MASNLEKAQITEDRLESLSPNSDSDDVDQNAYSKNASAVKGDKSDGKIGWNWKTRTAAVSLALLYVGK